MLRSIWLLGGLFLAAAVPQLAFAQVLILSSDTPQLPVNRELALSDRLDIPQGKSVRILLPSGGTRVLRGPLSSSVRDLTRGESRADAMWQRVRDFFSGQDNTFYAADRGPAMPLDWATIPVPLHVKESICVAKDAKPVFRRLDDGAANGGKAMKLYVGDGPSGKPFEVRWEGGRGLAAWPSSLMLIDGGRYFIAPDFAPAGAITVRLVDKAKLSGEEALNTLYASGCRDQFVLLLKQMRSQTP